MKLDDIFITVTEVLMIVLMLMLIFGTAIFFCAVFGMLGG